MVARILRGTKGRLVLVGDDEAQIKQMIERLHTAADKAGMSEDYFGTSETLPVIDCLTPPEELVQAIGFTKAARPVSKRSGDSFADNFGITRG